MSFGGTLPGLAAWAGGLLAVALVVIGTIRRRRIRELLKEAEPQIDDLDVARIVEDGFLSLDDSPPLDLDEIAEEEDRFWQSESWESAEEM